MKCIEIKDAFIIPVNKVCNVIANEDNERKLTIWLDSGAIQTIDFGNKTRRDQNFNMISDFLKSL
jgi:hypothetical protein